MLVLLVLTVQVIFVLYARSVVTAATVDAVRSVTAYSSAQTYDLTAAGPDPQELIAERTAVDRARTSLGGYRDTTTFTWLPSRPGEVALRVTFHLRGTSFGLIDLPLLDTFSRTVRARVEHIVCPVTAGCTVIGGTGP